VSAPLNGCSCESSEATEVPAIREGVASATRFGAVSPEPNSPLGIPVVAAAGRGFGGHDVLSACTGDVEVVGDCCTGAPGW